MADASLRQRRKPPAAPPPAAAPEDKWKLPPTDSQTTLQLSPWLVCYMFIAFHVICAIYHPIQDCDEVFNYWEPVHYLTHGYGFQTWEYSPVYAIRSWAYAGLHALVTICGKPLAAFTGSKAVELYLLRIVLGSICAICVARLYSKIAVVLNPRIAITFFLIIGSSPGMYHASTTFLPSSFAMYTTMLAMAAFMDWRGGLRTAQGIFAIGAGAVLGWPFAVAMAVPYLIEEVLYGAVGDQETFVQMTLRFTYGTTRTLLVLAAQVAVDSLLYRKLVVVPFNIIWYNVFSGKGGPELYGTEPWHFYIRNLFLNFHVWFILALLALPLLLVQHLFNFKGATKSSHLRAIVFLTPFYLWLFIFTLQPHKEERFMYPAYPALALNAAVAFYIIFANLGSTDPQDTISKIPVQIRLPVIVSFVVLSVAISVLRTIGTFTAYDAPLKIYKPLHGAEHAQNDSIVCLGKEWYRFPSHFLLPSNMRAKFVKSEFSGLLPGEFHEGALGSGLGMLPGTWLEPPGMNDGNREDLGKYTDLKYCNYLVDLRLPSAKPTEREPDYLAESDNWERVKCLPFLDAASTGLIGRLIWVPKSTSVPERYRRVWGEYCLLKRRRKQTRPRMDPAPHVETLG